MKTRKLKAIPLAVLLSCLCLTGCGKQKGLNEVKDVALFGSTPEKAGEMLGVDFSEIEPQAYESLFEADIYRLPEAYPVGENRAEMEFYFLKDQTPAGTPLGLGVIVLYLGEGADLEELGSWMAETYELQKEPGYTFDEEGKAETLYWSRDLTTERQELSVDDAVEETFGPTPYAGPYFTISGRVKTDGTALVTIMGISGAVRHHIEDYPHY